MEKIVKSGDVKYNIKIRMEDLTLEQAKADAFKYYIWKLQRVIRDADESQRLEWQKNGINLHWSEVGKKIESAEEIVDKMTDEMAREAMKRLQARLNKKK